MSVASELTKLQTDITNAYTAVNGKGGTIPSNKNTNNLATAINSIVTGGGGGGSTNSKVWILNHTDSGNKDDIITIASNDSWVAQHYTDNTFTITIIGLQPPTTLSALYFYGGIHCNTSWYADTSRYGRSIRSQISSPTIGDNYFNVRIDNATHNNGFNADSSGNLKFKVRDGGAALYLGTGTYIIIAGYKEQTA